MTKQTTPDMIQTSENLYIENGYEGREDYLGSLSDEYAVDLETVHYLADLLGESEDFDGLVNALQDAESGF